MPVYDLSKIRVPKGALRVEVDDPDHYRIEKPAGIIRGWFAAQDVQIPEDFHFKIGTSRLPHSIVQRTDVETAMPEYTITGFQISYDLACWLPYIADHRLVVHLILPGYDSLLLRFTIRERALASCLASASDLNA